jgi:hypothetical protein
MPAIHSILPNVTVIERRNMTLWEDDAARAEVVQTGRRRLLVSGLLTEACVSFPVPIVEEHAGGSGIGLAYACELIKNRTG